MRPDVVEVVTPKGQLAAGVGQVVEDLVIQAFVAQAAIEGLDVAVLLRLARVDVMPFDAVLVSPLQDGLAGELGAPPQENDPPDRFLIFVDPTRCRPVCRVLSRSHAKPLMWSATI